MSNNVSVDIANFLNDGLVKLPFVVDEDISDKLLEYLRLLNKWNHVHNLTAIRDIKSQITHHFLDCLSITPFLSNVKNIADIGSGAGFPGMLIALVNPDIKIFAVESNSKKSAFLRTVKRELDLHNASIINQRVEKWEESTKMDVIISRAVSSIDVFLSLTAHLGDNHSKWMLMKSRAEENCANASFFIASVKEIDVPYLEAKRTLVTIQRK